MLSFANLGKSLKAGGSAEVVMLRLEDDLDSSSLLNTSVLQGMKQVLHQPRFSGCDFDRHVRW